MKLLFLSIEFPPGPGGIGALAHQIASYMARGGHHVFVSTPQGYVSPSEIGRFNGGQPFSISRLKPVEPALLEGLYRFIQAMCIVWKRRPDAVVAIGKQAVWLGAAISSVAGVPLLAIGCGSEFLRSSSFGRFLTRWAFGRAHRLVAISNYTQDLMAVIGIDVSKTEIIPPGADGSLYCPDLPIAPLREQMALGGKYIILTVGQVSERKAQDTVIRALPQILKRCPNTHYLIAGLETRRQELERLAESLGVGEHVTFMGQVPQDLLPSLYNLADVFVLVSRRAGDEVEGFGIVVVEAALCATPAVVSRNCGLVEAVVENETALVVNPDDPGATAQAIIRLLLDDDLRAKMGQTAHRHAIENATLEARLKAYDGILESLVSQG
ncbi:MAG: glycosyltransferase family 4 protein [Anaerolineae bacterium]